MNIVRRNNVTVVVIMILSVVAAIIGIGYLLTSSKQATAAPSTTYTSIDMSDPWTVIRGHNSGGHTAMPSSLEVAVDNTDPGTDATEGLMKTIPDSDSIRAKLLIDPDWQTKDVRAGLWGQVYSPTYDPATSTLDTGPAWPIIEFTTMGSGGFTGFRVYDTRGGASPQWYNLTSVPFSYGQTYNLEIAYDESTESYKFYVDDNEVLSLPTSRSDDDNTPRSIFREILFASYNSATGDTDDDYTALWTNAQYGIVQNDPEPPTPPAPSTGSGSDTIVPGVPNTGRR